MTATSGPALFHSVCSQAGLALGVNGSPNVLQTEPSRFQREVARLIQWGSSGSSCVDLFLDGLQDYLEDPETLRRCLVSMASPGDKGSTSLNESLVRLLLNVDSIQPGLTEALLDRILGSLSEDESEPHLPKLILQQFKWLSNIIEPSRLSSKLLEVINISPISTQRDIIISIPEILPDSEHKTVVLGLAELMESSSELMVPILDALSNLNLQSDVLIGARGHVMNKLESAELEDLPVVIKFLLQTVEPDTVDDVISTIRNNLDFRSISKLQKKSKHRAATHTPEVLILDALKTGIRFQKFVTDAWLKALAAIPTASQHVAIDVIVMFILHSIVSLKKKVEVMIRKKVIDGLLTRKLLEETILVHGASLREYMPAILSISENLLRSSLNHPIVTRTASTLYTASFQISDAYYRQEIVGSLLVHIGSGSAVEIDASLLVLRSISQHSRSTLKEYSIFIKGVLDYLDNLSLEQIRLLFIVLGSLAREEESSAGSGSLLTDLNIIIRKQLSNPMHSVKQIGVMGAVALVQAFGVKEPGMHERGSSSQAATHVPAESDPLLRTSVQYLQMIKDSCQKSAICLSLTFDELASMVLSHDIDPRLVDWIKEEFSNHFVDTFVCGADETFTMRPSRNIATERWMNLDGPESELSLSIIPNLCSEVTSTTPHGTAADNPDAIVYLCSMFKLMQATEKATSDEGLDEIDGLLGCGITMFKHEYLQDLHEIYSTEICHTIAQALLCAINWFREIANAFSYDAGDQTMARIILRLQQISELEDMLRHVLKSTPGFQPLEATLSKGQEAPGVTIFSRTGSLSIQPQGTSAFAGKLTMESVRDDISSASTFPVNSSEIVTFESLAPFLRELEIDVFQVLRVHYPITRPIFEMSEINDNNSVQLQYQELRLLLRDLSAKVTFKLFSPAAHVPSRKRAMAFAGNFPLLNRMKTQEFVQGVLKIVPHLITKTRIMLKVLSDDEAVAVNNLLVTDCLGLSLKILNTLLSWNELSCSDQKDIRLKLLQSLAQDGKSAEQIAEMSASVNLSKVASLAFHDLAAWRELMPNFETSVSLLEVLEKILELVPKNQETAAKASKLATEILSNRWPPSDPVKNDKLAYVLGQQIGRSAARLEMILEYVTQVLPSFLGQTEDFENLHPLLNNNNFTTYTKVLYIQLSSLAGEFDEAQFDSVEEAFDHISSLALCFQKLAAYVKSTDKRDVLGVTLRHSKAFMEQFIKRVLPFLGMHFRGHQDSVSRIFKNYLQTATRSLQSVCGHAKASKEQSLMAMVPSIKKTMESLIFEVKLMLENNNAGAAFWLGNLKHRNLAGEEISSQFPVESEDDTPPSDRDMEDIDQSDDAPTSSRKKKHPSSRRKHAQSAENPEDHSDDPTTKPKKKRKRPQPQPQASKPKTHDKPESRESGESRIHSRSQITNSDMSDDEEDQLDGEDDERTLTARQRPVVDAADSESEDDYDGAVIEQQDEKLEKRRRVRNPYIDDTAMDGDDDEEDEEDEEDDEDDEEEDEEEEEEEDEESDEEDNDEE